MSPAGPAASAGPLGPARLAALIARARWRARWNGLRRGPPAARAAWLLAVLGPAAYVGLFATALDALAEAGGPAVAHAALALVAAAIALASFAAKAATGDAVIGAGGESEHLLSHPLSVATLVIARCLAGVVTEIVDALFLLPILLAASFAWGLGPPALAAALLISVFAQLIVSALAQAAQIVVVRAAPPRARRALWTALALLAALALATLWMLGSTVLRDPTAAAVTLQPFVGALRFPRPGGLLAAPLVALHAGDPHTAGLALAWLAAHAALALALAAALARLAARGGWEQAGAPWADAREAAAPRAPITLFRKDWRLLTRDRTRLVTLLAMPALFVGLQVFGSAGWAWSVASPARVAIVAFSLAAYAATFGPLTHMQAERRAFWLLRAAPVPIGSLFAVKARFWSLVVGGLAAAVCLALGVPSGHLMTGAGLGLAALAVVGAVVVTFLAVGLGAGAADLSDDAAPAVGVGTAYVFMLVAGLFNLVLLEDGLLRLRALLLYVLCAAICWRGGVRRAEEALDPGSERRRALSPAGGAVLAILLFLGTHAAARAADALELAANSDALLAACAGAVAVIAAVLLAGEARHRRTSAPFRPSLRSWALGLALGALGAAVVRAVGAPLPGGLPALAAAALAEELAIRGVLQRSLAETGASFRSRAAAALPSAAAGLLVASDPRPAVIVCGAILPAVAQAGAPGLAPFVARALIVLAASTA